MTKRKDKPIPTDAELIDWLGTVAHHLRFRLYSDILKSELDDSIPGKEPVWNIYNGRLGRGSNAPTLREAMTLAWRADTMPRPKKKISAQAAEALVLSNGLRLGELPSEQISRILRWARGRTKTNTLQAACEILLKTRGFYE